LGAETRRAIVPANKPNPAKTKKSQGPKDARAYDHEEKLLLRPDVGLQSQFKQKKPPKPTATIRVWTLPSRGTRAPTASIKAKEFDQLVAKLGLRTRDSADVLAWFEFEGKIITCTRRSRGSGDLHMQHSIRQQLKLNEEQLRKAVGCHLTKEDSIKIPFGSL
jgi:hypothetical protein